MSLESPLRNGNAADFDLIETLRWQPQAGFVRLDRHLARLGASAAGFDFDYDADAVTSVLEDAVGQASDTLRVRLLLSRHGRATATTHPYQPLPAGQVWTLRLAQTRLDSTDPLLRHKTSWRETYMQARAEYTAADADEILLANERGELCEGTITSIFADFGEDALATPRLDCGLLPGVLRAEMLEEGRAYEAVFGLEELASATAMFVGNSLRGLIPARLV